jgi:hypothetical protein
VPLLKVVAEITVFGWKRSTYGWSTRCVFSNCFRHLIVLSRWNFCREADGLQLDFLPSLCLTLLNKEWHMDMFIGDGGYFLLSELYLDLCSLTTLLPGMDYWLIAYEKQQHKKISCHNIDSLCIRKKDVQLLTWKSTTHKIFCHNLELCAIISIWTNITRKSLLVI